MDILLSEDQYNGKIRKLAKDSEEEVNFLNELPFQKIPLDVAEKIHDKSILISEALVVLFPWNFRDIRMGDGDYRRAIGKPLQ